MGAKPLTTVSTAQSVVPEWYTNTAQDLLASQNALLNQPYQPYDGARLAGLTDAQLAGLEQARISATGYQPILDRALEGSRFDPSGFDAAQTTFGNAQTTFGNAQGALGQATRSAANIAGSLGAGGLDAAQPWFSQAGGMSAYDAASPTLGGALSYATGATDPTGLRMAAPWLNAASDNVADVSAYMNPYEDAVVRRIGDIGARTLREQLAPAINDKFIRSGQLMSSGQSIDEARALRDVAADVTAQQAQLLQSGYGAAQAAKAGDLARYGSLAGTAGNLGFQQQGALSTAAGQIAGIGTSLGNLTDADRNALVEIGRSSGALGAGDANARLQAATAQAAADLNVAQQAGALGQQQGALGQQQGALAQAIASLGLQGAQQTGALAAQQQNQQIAGANALTTAGGLEQSQQQKALDIQYADYLRQQGYPQAQIDAALKTFQGVSGGVPQGTVGFEQQTKTGSSPSVASQFLGGLAAAKGVGVI